MCFVHLRSLETWTPSSLNTDVSYSRNAERQECWWIFRNRADQNLLGLAGINVHPYFFWLVHKLIAAGFHTSYSWLATNSDSVVSSTNLCVGHEVRKQSTRVMNINGLRYDPWGIPAFTTSQDTTSRHARVYHPPIRHHVANFNTLTPMIQEWTYLSDYRIWQSKVHYLATRTLWLT